MSTGTTRNRWPKWASAASRIWASVSVDKLSCPRWPTPSQPRAPYSSVGGLKLGSGQLSPLRRTMNEFSTVSGTPDVISVPSRVLMARFRKAGEYRTAPRFPGAWVW